MKIDFAGQPLCSGERMDSPKGFSIKNSRLLQTSEPLRAVEAIQRSRKNERTDVAFAVQRSHGTIQAAEAFALSHWNSLPERGTLSLSADDGSHTRVKTSFLANTVLEDCEVSYNGMLSLAKYTFKGGKPTTTKPT